MRPDDVAYSPPPPPRPPPPPPPPPEDIKEPETPLTPEQEEAFAAMEPEQVAAYGDQLSQLSQTDQQNVANNLAGSLDAETLAMLRGGFGDAPGGLNMVDQAVLNFAPADVAGGYPAAVLASNPELNDALLGLGLSQEDIDAATTETIAALGDAAQLASEGKYSEALQRLQDIPEVGKELAAKAFASIAGQIPNLPQEVKDILADDEAVAQLLEAGARVIEAIGNGDVQGILQAVTDPDLRNALIDALLANPDSNFSQGVAALGLDAQDLKDAGNAIPDLLSAAIHAGKGEWKQAALALADAAETAPDLTAEALQAIAGQLGEPAASILGDDAVAAELANASPDVLRDLINGKPVDALKKLADNEALRNAVLDAAIENDDGTLAAALDRIGIDIDNEDDIAALKEAGAGLPALIEAAELAATAETAEDWKAVALKLVEASSHAPQLVADGIQELASHLPEPAKSILGDEAVAAQLAEASPEALTALINGNPLEALKHLASDEDLRNAVIDAAIEHDPTGPFVTTLARIGIDVNDPAELADLKAAGDALPTLIEAAELAATAQTPEDWKNVGLKLADAADQAPELVAEMLQHVAGNLPDGLAKTILTDPAVATELANASPEVLRNLLNGDPAAALSAVGDNEALRDALIEAAAKDPAIAALMADNGITVEMLKEAGDAAPHLFNAIKHAAAGEYAEALEAFKLAGEAAPELLGRIGQAIYDKLPPETREALTNLGINRETIAEAAAALPHLVDAAEAAANGEWTNALDALVQAGQAAPGMAKDAIKALAENLLPAGTAKEILTNDKVLDELLSNPDVHAAIGKLFSGDVDTALEGARDLLANDTIRDEVLTAIGANEQVQAALEKIGLTAEDLVAAGAAIPHLIDVAISLSESPPDWQGALDALAEAGTAAAPVLEKVIGKVYDELPPEVRTKFESLGITRQDLQEAGAALPHFVGAIQALLKDGGPDWQGALQSLGLAIDAAPGLVTKAILALGSQIPDKIQPLKSLLTNENLVSTLISNDELHASVQDLLNGDVAEGLKGIANNPEVMSAVAEVLADNPAFMEKMALIGIDTAEELAALGPAIAGGIELIEALTANPIDPQAVMAAFGDTVESLPDDVRGTIIDSIVSKLDLKPEFKEMISAVLEATTDPDVIAAIGEAFEAFKSGDPLAFIQALGATAKTILESSDSAATAFLNALSKLPGPIGEFFADAELNAAIVDTGSLDHVLAAIEKLTQGDLLGAVQELGKSVMALIGSGDHYKIEVDLPGPWNLSEELPFGEQGLEMIGRLFGRFIEALPDRVKKFITDKVAEIAAGLGLKSVPGIGSIVGIVDSGIELVGTLTSGDADGFDIALDVADLVVNVAGLIPGATALTGPLSTLIGLGEAVKDAADMVGDVTSFAEELTGM